MVNPLSPVKTQDKRIEKIGASNNEVQVQFAKENPAWIPLENTVSDAKRYKVSKKIEDPKLKLILAHQQIEKPGVITEDNPYSPYIYQHLNPIKYVNFYVNSLI